MPVTQHEKFISGLSVAKTPRSEMRRRPVVPIPAGRWQPCRKGALGGRKSPRQEAEKQEKDKRKIPCEFLIPERRIINFFGRRKPGTVSSFLKNQKRGQMYRKLHEGTALEGRMYRKLHDKMALEGRMYRAGHVGGVGRAEKLARLSHQRGVCVPDFSA